jgi:hypothetical protein
MKFSGFKKIDEYKIDLNIQESEEFHGNLDNQNVEDKI